METIIYAEINGHRISNAKGIKTVRQISPGVLDVLLEVPVKPFSVRWSIVPSTPHTSFHFVDVDDTTKRIELRQSGVISKTPASFRIQATTLD